MELQFLREEVRKLKQIVGVCIYPYLSDLSQDDDAGSGKEDSDKDSEEEEEVGQLLSLPKQPMRKGPRCSVSAEVFGKWNKKEEFKAPKYPKAPQVRDALKKRLEQAFMFSSLNPDELSIVLDAM